MFIVKIILTIVFVKKNSYVSKENFFSFQVKTEESLAHLIAVDVPLAALLFVSVVIIVFLTVK